MVPPLGTSIPCGRRTSLKHMQYFLPFFSHSFSSLFSLLLQLFMLLFCLSSPSQLPFPPFLLPPLCALCSTPLLQRVPLSQVGAFSPRFFNLYFCSNGEGRASAEPTFPRALSQHHSLAGVSLSSAEGSRDTPNSSHGPAQFSPVQTQELSNRFFGGFPWRGHSVWRCFHYKTWPFLGALGYFVPVHSRQMRAG